MSEQDDDKLWEEVAASVKPLPGKKAHSTPAKEKPPRKPKVKPVPAPSAESAPHTHKHLFPLTVGTMAGVDANTAQKLRRGQMPIDARLDLHGLYQDEAHEKLRRFIAGATGMGHRCVLVITGKGGVSATTRGVLREMVPRWLNLEDLRPFILCLCYAQPKDGGTGALYVLLRRRR